jgi:hypothetical protein
MTAGNNGMTFIAAVGANASRRRDTEADGAAT